MWAMDYQSLVSSRKGWDSHVSSWQCDKLGKYAYVGKALCGAPRQGMDNSRWGGNVEARGIIQ